MVRRPIALLVLAALAAAACSANPEGDDPASSPTSIEQTGPIEGRDATSTTTGTTGTTAIEDYPDAQTRALAVRARERRPVENSALPPRHLEPDRHRESLVDRNRIVSGGPPPDGIPSIDDPTFVPVDAVDWLADEEPVAVLDVDGETRIYPTQILLWHEIVNDEVGGRPVTMTYCPLCNSVVAFEATVAGPDGQELTLDFGTSGALYQSALVMYDRQTESLWTHFDGRAVMGDLIGAELAILPAAMVSWADARDASPDGRVLDRPTGPLARPYGTAPYPNYETADPTAAYLTETVDDRLPEKARVVGVDLGQRPVAIDRRALTVAGLVAVDIGDRHLIALWEPGTASALDGEAVAGGLEVGAVGVFDATVDGRRLTFDQVGDQVGDRVGDTGAGGAVVDRETGSMWSVLGRAVSGPLAGRRLQPVAHLDTFWFAWSRYHPDTELVG